MYPAKIFFTIMAKINVFSEENNQIENKRQQNKRG